MDRKRPKTAVFCGPGPVFGRPGIRADRFGPQSGLRRSKNRDRTGLLSTINNRKIEAKLYVTGLGKERIILGFPWLNEQNPDINWRTGEFTWRKSITRRLLKLPLKQKDEATLLTTPETKKPLRTPTTIEE